MAQRHLHYCTAQPCMHGSLLLQRTPCQGMARSPAAACNRRLRNPQASAPYAGRYKVFIGARAKEQLAVTFTKRASDMHARARAAGRSSKAQRVIAWGGPCMRVCMPCGKHAERRWNGLRETFSVLSTLSCTESAVHRCHLLPRAALWAMPWYAMACMHPQVHERGSAPPVREQKLPMPSTELERVPCPRGQARVRKSPLVASSTAAESKAFSCASCRSAWP